MRSRIWSKILLTCAILMISRFAWACSACFGNPDSPQTQAMGMAILTLLIITAGVLASLAGFFIYLIARKSQKGSSLNG